MVLLDGCFSRFASALGVLSFVWFVLHGLGGLWLDGLLGVIYWIVGLGYWVVGIIAVCGSY